MFTTNSRLERPLCSTPTKHVNFSFMCRSSHRGTQIQSQFKSCARFIHFVHGLFRLLRPKSLGRFHASSLSGSSTVTKSGVGGSSDASPPADPYETTTSDGQAFPALSFGSLPNSATVSYLRNDRRNLTCFPCFTYIAYIPVLIKWPWVANLQAVPH